MKRFHWRETALLCAPIAVLGVAFLLPRVLRSPPKLDAATIFSVQQRPFPRPPLGFNPPLQFSWEATATNGPIGYQEKIVAYTPKGARVIYASVPLGTLPTQGVAAIAGTAEGWSWTGQTATLTRDLQIPSNTIPLTVKRLEWRGEIVALPPNGNLRMGVQSAATLRKWATMKGAARVVKVIALSVRAPHATVECEVEAVKPSEAAQGIDTDVTIRVLNQERRVFRQLVAFDGRTRRVLWSDGAEAHNLWWKGSSENTEDIQTMHVWFALRHVPASWGEIVFLYDAVYAGENASGSENPATSKTLDSLQKAGGVRFSRHVVVRRMGQTITLPPFQKTPNLRLLNVQTQKATQGARILVALHYLGSKSRPVISRPALVELFDAKGEFIDGVEQSTDLQPGAAPNEWILSIKLARYKSPLQCRMKFSITDGEAAPLNVERQLKLP